MSAASWSAWTDVPAYRPRYSRPERRVLKALAEAEAEAGRRPRLAEVEALMPPDLRPRTCRLLEGLVRRGRVARGIYDAMSYRDLQAWRGAKQYA